MIDFSTLKGLTIPEGVVTQITDESGRVIWAVQSDKAILEVKKLTSVTYAGGTTYDGEEFILLNIYPKTNGTVNITYGGLTKTITDTSGAAEPNAQQVFFGTFNGVSDSVETPESGVLTIEGDYYGFGNGNFSSSKIMHGLYTGNIAKVLNFGKISIIPNNAFSSMSMGGTQNFAMATVNIPNGVTAIGSSAFYFCSALKSVIIPNSVISIGNSPFYSCDNLTSIVVDSGNKYYSVEDGVLFNHSKTDIITIAGGVVKSAYTIPNGVTTIVAKAFEGYDHLESVVISEAVTFIGKNAFYLCSSLETVTFVNTEGWEWINTDTNSRDQLDVTDPTTNAKMLRQIDNYNEGKHDWRRT
jgi:hypothetical protein